MKKLILILILLFAMVGTACALPTPPDTMVVWDEVATRVDGSDYPVSERGGYKVYCKPVSTSDFTDTLSIVVAESPVLFIDLPCYTMPGQKDYGVTAIDTENKEGEMGVPTTRPFVPQRGADVRYGR